MSQKSIKLPEKKTFASLSLGNFSKNSVKIWIFKITQIFDDNFTLSCEQHELYTPAHIFCRSEKVKDLFVCNVLLHAIKCGV